MNDTQILAIALPSVPTILAVLIGILINNHRLGDVNARLGDVNARLGDMRSEYNTRLTELRAHMDGRFDEMRSSMPGSNTWKSAD